MVDRSNSYCSIFSLFQFSQSEKLAYVDTAKLLNGYHGMKVARASFEKKAAEWNANVDTLTQEIQQMIMVHEKELSTMSDREKKLSEELLRTKQQQLVQYQQAIRQKAQEEDSRMTQTVLDDVNAYITEYGKKQGYSIIMATTNGNIVYAEDVLDITDEVLEGLNQ